MLLWVRVVFPTLLGEGMYLPQIQQLVSTESYTKLFPRFVTLAFKPNTC